MAISPLSVRSTVVVVVVLATCLVALVFQLSDGGHLRPSIPYRLCRVGEGPDRQAEAQDLGATILADNTLFTSNRFLLNMSHTMDEKLRGRLLPKNTGVIWTAHNETFRLGMGISMFHAMHCLLFLRSVLQDRLDGADISSSAYRSRRGESLHTHVPHCFSYVTQHVMCLGDSTIEPPWIEKDAAGNIQAFGIDGYGTHHKCKDTTRMLGVARRARTETFDPWDWQDGDTVETVFGS